MISELGVANSSAEVHPAGTVVLSRTASVGFSCILGRDMATSQDFATWTCGPRLSPRYLLYALRGQPHEIEQRKTGSTHKTIYMPDIETLRVPLPPAEAQRLITGHLDAEMARIDAVIAKKRRMIELLELRVRESFVHRLVGSRSPSAQLRRAFSFLTDGPFGSAFSSSDYSQAGAAVVRLGNIGFAEYRPDDQAHIPLALYESFLRHRVRSGDLLIAGLGDANNHAGRACVAPDLGPAIVKGKCFCARINTDVALPDYLALLLSSPLGADAIGLSGRGSTRTMINLDVVKSVVLPLPSLDTQATIIEVTKAEAARVRLVSSRLAAQIKLLAEHRQALITAAVTGDLEIPGVAA